jgi:nitrogen fixation NifU-like protein
MSLNDLFTEIILDHYQHPHNHGLITNASYSSRGYNESCGDDIQVSVIVRDGVITDAKFSGVGCSISQASASIMTDLVKGKTIEEAKQLAVRFYDMVKGIEGDYGEEMGDSISMQGVSKFPVRVKCATLGWHTLEEAFAKGDNKE